MFTLRNEQLYALRKKTLGDGLADTLRAASFDVSRDEATGDVVARNAAGDASRFGFDDKGFIGSVTSPTGRVWSMANDEDGRVVSARGPSGLDASFAYDASGRLVSAGQGGRPKFAFDYDDAGRMASVQHPDGTRAAFHYGPAGRLAAYENRLGEVEEFDHDAHARLTAIRDGNGNQTTFAYARRGRPESAAFADGTVESYQYDPAGRVAAIVSHDGAAAEIARDAAGRVVEIAYGDGRINAFAYDDDGRLVEARSDSAVVRYVYDGEGRVVAEDQDGQAVRYEYNALGLLAALVYPTGERVAYEYDADARPSLVVDWQGGAHRYAYAPEDCGFTIDLPSGLAIRARLTPTGRAKAFVTSPGRSNTGASFSFVYEYDDEGRVRSAVDSDLGAKTYAYDVEGRLIAVEHEAESARRGARESFDYDAAGNPIRWGGEHAEYDAMNRLVARGGTSCRYDARGNTVGLDSPEGNWRFAYNQQNLMTRAERDDGLVVEYGYDAFARRVWKRSAGRETRYIWAGEQILREVVADAPAESRDILYAPGSYAPLAMRRDGRVYAFHTDQNGVPRRLTDPSGRVVWSADYTAYGRARIHISEVDQPFRFLNHWHDPETGLHYNRFRYYSPALGRYLTRDPIGFLAGTNVYAYAHADPVNDADPLGLWGWKGIVSAVAGVVTGVAVAAVVVATAPVSLPAIAVGAGAVLLGGAAAGAVAMGTNEALNQEKFCLSCIFKAAGKGLLVGLAGALPFAALPVGAGYLAVMAAGALSGAIAYAADWALTPHAKWSWGGFATSVGLGAVTAGLGKYIHGKLTGEPEGVPPGEEPEGNNLPPPGEETNPPRLPQDVNVNPEPPDPLPLDRPIGNSPTQNARLQADIAQAQAEGATDIRVNQQQVNADGVRVGTNRPDLQYTDANGRRVYVEYDTSTSDRGPGHYDRIRANDPDGTVILETVD